MSEPSFGVEVRDGEPPVVHVAGEIDVVTGPLLWAHVQPLATHGGSLVLDLGDVDFMDSTGINILVRARRRGAELTVRRASEHIRRLLEVTGLTDVVHVED